MPLQIVIPDGDPLITLLMQRAKYRGLGTTTTPEDRARLRKRLPRLARDLIRERLLQLNAGVDPMAPLPLRVNISSCEAHHA